MLSPISLIVPTRGRPERLRAFLRSLVATAERPELLEVVLVIDADDVASLQVAKKSLQLRRAVVSPGLTMGALNQAGYQASSGDIVMLLNDDVTAHTPGWDMAIRRCFDAFADGVVLVHVNDTVFQKALCTFPVLSRRFCDRIGEICPRAYQRYRIDDHIEDYFNLLGVLGERRSLYLPDVVFEHDNHVTNENGVRQYFAEPTALAEDARLFEATFARRKELALQLKIQMARGASSRQVAAWRARLDAVPDSFSLRRPERLRVVPADELTGSVRAREPWANEFRQRLRRCYCEKGYRGLARALLRRLRPTSLITHGPGSRQASG